VKKTQNKGYYGVHGHQGHRGRYQSKACMRLSSPFGGLGTTYDVHLGLTGKCVVDFLLALIELFSLGVTDELQRVKR